MNRGIFRERIRRFGGMCIPLLAVCVSGCAGTRCYFGQGCVTAGIEERTGHTLGACPCAGEITVPDTVDCHDGITEAEAVALALWNSPQYQELLADLGLTRASVIEAGQLTNPEFWAVFPVGVKQLEFALNVPLDAVWLRPRRLAAAKLESQRIGNRLVQDGLDLVRDVRGAFSDLVLAQDRLRLAEEGARLRSQITELAEARLEAGSASELEVMTARIDELMEEGRAGRVGHDVALARQRLRFLMGVEFTDVAEKPAVLPEPPRVEMDPGQLVEQALASRPDLWAAEFGLQAARQRERLAKWDYLNVTGVLPDANGAGKKGFEAGPGATFTVPVFHQNQGAVARAHAEVEKARRGWETLRHKIVMEVRQAHSRVVQAQEDLDKWEVEILPVAEDAVATSEKAYSDGGASLLLMLLNSRQLLESQLRRSEAAADLRKAMAELDRSVGQRVVDSPTFTEAPALTGFSLDAVENTP